MLFIAGSLDFRGCGSGSKGYTRVKTCPCTAKVGNQKWPNPVKFGEEMLILHTLGGSRYGSHPEVANSQKMQLCVYGLGFRVS